MCGAEKVRHMLMGEQVLKKWKKSKKMTVAFGGILVMSVVIGGCGGREDAKKSIKIGISVYDQYDTFVSEMMKDFNDYATKKEEETGVAINIDTYNASASQSTQNSQVENMITEGCDVICVNLVDRTDPTAIIDLAEKNNIPVIFFNPIRSRFHPPRGSLPQARPRKRTVAGQKAYSRFRRGRYTCRSRAPALPKQTHARPRF